MVKKPSPTALPVLSLLDPAADLARRAFQHWGKTTPADLGLEQLTRALSYGPKYEPAVRDILLALSPETSVIAYRQEILQDFLEQPELAAGFAEVLPFLSRLRDSAEARASGYEETLHQTLGRLTELNTYLKVVGKMRQALQTGPAGVKSPGLRALVAWLAEIEAEETFQTLSRSLPDLVARLHGIPSLTIGINLDHEFLPVEAVLLSINEKPFKGSSLLDRLVGSQQNRKADQGIGPLHVVENDFVDGIDGRTVKLETRRDPLLVPLFRDLNKILKATLVPISKELRRYAQIQAERLLPLENELAFYLGAVKLIQRLQSHGLPVCRPEVLPSASRETHLEGMYNLLLALHRMTEADGASLREAIILNEVDFGPQGRIFILTGPNQGGKTVYTQAVGMAQLFFQAGLWVPA